MKPATGQVIYGVDGRKRFALLPLDEAALFADGAEVDQALAMSVAAQDGLIAQADLGTLPIVDYELILARFGIANFGDSVAHNITCDACGKRYGVEFSLGTYAEMVAAEVTPHLSAEFLGYPLQLPSRDKLAAAGPDGPVALLWNRSAPLKPADIAAVEDYLSRACPILQEDIQSACPECNATQKFRFVLRDWLSARLAARYKGIVAQVHLIASAYHWQIDQIFALSSDSRGALVQAIRAQRGQLAPGGIR